MPRFQPFAGLRFDPAVAGPVADMVAPPYDVVTPELRRALLERSRYNVVRLELPSDPGRGPGGTDCYHDARGLLDRWRAEGVLRRDPGRHLYAYRMTTPGPGGTREVTVGVIGALGVEDEGIGVLPHEETISSVRSDRRRLLEELRVNVSPIWALTPAAGLASLVSGAWPDADTAPTPPQGTPPEGTPPGSPPGSDVVDADGVEHSLRRLDDPACVDAVSRLVASKPLVLADGHHRYETAQAYLRSRPHGDAGAAALMALVVELSADHVHVQAIHRLLRGLRSPGQALELLARGYDLTPSAPVDATIGARMRQAGASALVTPTGTWLARPSAATEAASSHDLDASRLDAVLGAVAGLDVGYQHGWRRATDAVRDGRADAAVLLRPVSIDQIADVARGAVRMPPKTTFFWPKPRTGMVLRELDA